MKRVCLVVLSLAVIAGCASTSVTPISRTEFLLSTSAAPACGATGAAKVASKMAAVETLRRGFDRYMIIGAASENNVSVYSTGPTIATTYGTGSLTGNYYSGSSTTYYGGSQTIYSGSHDSEIRVRMFTAGQPGYDDALDAKRELGAEWEKLVKNGVKSCG